jgi:hypothetical protein
MLAPMDAAGTPARGERTGAVLLAILALGLLFVAADIITGGRLAKRGGCGCNDSDESGA